MAKLVRPDALYKQLASELREAIHQGDYPPGTPLPSENVLVERYGVSKPTVRLALAALRGEGLIKVVNGKGSYVRDTVGTAPAIIVYRDLSDPWHGVHSTGEPEHSRLEADARLAALLGVEQHEPLFILDQSAQDLATGRTVLTRRIVPFSVTEGISLENHPYPDRNELLRILREAYGELVTQIYTRAYLPHPDQATALNMLDATPVLETTWTTLAPNGRALLAETETANAEGVQYAYRCAPQ
jgi:GntR family transcriptional regulator